MDRLPKHLTPRETAFRRGETYYRLLVNYICEYCGHNSSHRAKLGHDTLVCIQCGNPLVIHIRSKLLAKLVGRQKHETYLPGMLK